MTAQGRQASDAAPNSSQRSSMTSSTWTAGVALSAMVENWQPERLRSSTMPANEASPRRARPGKQQEMRLWRRRSMDSRRGG